MKKILVIGDSCRDIFVYCEGKRMAPDLPIPVLQVVHKTQNPGMAKNVERNIKALYPSCDIITNDNWQRVTKTRYMHDKTNQAFCRIDSTIKVPRINVRAISLKKYDIVAISDYHKGFLTEEDIQYITEHHPLVFIDTKKPLGPYLKKVRYIKINESEYAKAQPVPQYLARKVICTKAERGAEFRGKNYPVGEIEVKDSSGAGDSFFAALVVHYAKTDDIEGAIQFANLCAKQVVQHKGVTVIREP